MLARAKSCIFSCRQEGSDVGLLRRKPVSVHTVSGECISCYLYQATVYLPNWDRGRPAALDVSVISTLQQLTLSGAANVTGYALSVAEDRKRASHEASCRDVGVSFVPLIFESLGGLSDLGCKTLHSIGRQLGLRVGVPISDSVRHLFQRCSVCLWRGNATLWLHCFSCPPPQTDSIL